MNRDHQSLLDMLQSAEIVLAYLDDVTETSFYKDEKLQDAVIRRLLVVGEAANRVSAETQQSLLDIAWLKIRGIRNRLVHEYDGIDLAIVWATTQTEIVELKAKLKAVLSEKSYENTGENGIW